MALTDDLEKRIDRIRDDWHTRDKDQDRIIDCADALAEALQGA
jgi:hypothetical protein